MLKVQSNDKRFEAMFTCYDDIVYKNILIKPRKKIHNVKRL